MKSINRLTIQLVNNERHPLKVDDVNTYLDFAEILEDDYEIMAFALKELANLKVRPSKIIESFENYTHGKYLDNIKEVLNLKSETVRTWKAMFKSNRGDATLLDFM